MLESFSISYFYGPQKEGIMMESDAGPAFCEGKVMYSIVRQWYSSESV